MQLLSIYSFISFLLHNGVMEHELQNIHHMILRGFGWTSVGPEFCPVELVVTSGG